MLDIKFIRENPEAVRKDLQKRNDKDKLALVDDLLDSDSQYRKLLQENQKLRQRRNEITDEINQMKKKGGDFNDKIKEAKELPDRIKQSDETIDLLKKKIKFCIMRIPNILHDSVPAGKD